MKNKQLWKNNDHKFILQTLNNRFFKKCYIISVYSDTVDYKNVRYLHTPTCVVGRNMYGKRFTVLGLSVFVLNVLLKSRLFKISQYSFLHTYKKIEPVALRLKNLLSKSSVERTNVLSTVKKIGNQRTVNFSGVVGVVPRKLIANAMQRVNNNLVQGRLLETDCKQIVETNKFKKQVFNRIIIKNNFRLWRTKIFKKTKFHKPNRIFKFLFRSNNLTKSNFRSKN